MIKNPDYFKHLTGFFLIILIIFNLKKKDNVIAIYQIFVNVVVIKAIKIFLNNAHGIKQIIIFNINH